MRVLLVSTYELGHQPIHIASAAACLAAAGHETRALDIAVEDWDPDAIAWADAIAFSVPMHTAMRLALEATAEVRRSRPDIPIGLFGLYANVRAAEGLVDRTIAGEYEHELVAWIDGLRDGPVAPRASTVLTRQRARLPVRSGLPPLERYARLAVGRTEHVAGYVEATRGCAHRCRHCPVPVVYDGRTRRVDVDVVLDDVAQQVAAGARHITFGDPDFLNRWAHSMQVVSELHARFPDVTYDITTKVEHVLRHADLLPDLRRTGCVFAVSAFECVNDEILAMLDKGHTAAEAERATALLRANGIEPRPSWLPFLPWSTVDDVADVIDFIVRNDLVANTDPVQLTIKLLIPEGSLMLEIAELRPLLGAYDPASLSYAWEPADGRTSKLQQVVTEIVEQGNRDGRHAVEIFADVADAAHDAAGRARIDREVILASRDRDVPRLTEAWFCCAEPTKEQFGSLASTTRA